VSDYETRVGKVRKVECLDTLEFIKDKVKDMDIPEYYDTDEGIIDFFRDEFYEKYRIIDGSIYEILEDKSLDDYDLFEARENSDGTIDYTLRYYNGGCGFDEALEMAIERMKDK
jgi:hypothetical protein